MTEGNYIPERGVCPEFFLDCHEQKHLFPDYGAYLAYKANPEKFEYIWDFVPIKENRDEQNQE